MRTAENKHEILAELAKVLKLTRAYKDLQKIDYVTDDGEEFAVITFPDEFFSVCITADSGAAAIRDVLRFLSRLD